MDVRNSVREANLIQTMQAGVIYLRAAVKIPWLLVAIQEIQWSYIRNTFGDYGVYLLNLMKLFGVPLDEEGL